MASKLETVDQKILKKLIILLYKKLSLNNMNSIYEYSLDDSSFFDELVSFLTTVGLEDNYDNIDFIFSLYTFNYSLFDKDGNLQKDAILKIPKIKKFNLEIVIDERRYMTCTYSHIIKSYSKNNVNALFQAMENNGDAFYSDGKLIYEDITDSDITDVGYSDPEELL
jgi:hypothetical protein